MAEWVDKAALPMDAPRHVVIAPGVAAVFRAGFKSALYERIGVIDENFGPTRGRANHVRAVPAVVGRLGQKERRAFDIHANDGAQVPEFSRTRSLADKP